MKKSILPLVMALLLAGTSTFAQSSAAIRQYIETFKQAAIDEELRSGVPAAITLAQGIHETSAGQSDLVRMSNNHFGIKCKGEWTGQTVSHDDDAKGECFRKYDDPRDSYKDHSDFLKTRAHYAFLFDLDPTDYEGWAYGLKKAGYATNPKYPQILIRLIKEYNLQDYTLIALGRKQAEPTGVWASTKTTVPSNEGLGPVAQKVSYPSGVFKINGTNVVYIAKGTPFLLIAQQNNVTLARLFEFNELIGSEEAAYDQLIYLQRKRKTGANETHTVQTGETLRSIAQAEGIRLESLLEYNSLRENMQPEVGETLQLHRKSSGMPRLVNAIKQAVASVGPKRDKEEVPEVQPTVEVYTVHVVKPKETLYSIAKRYAVSMEDVKKWNNLQTSVLKTGQQLRINKKAANVTYKSA